MSTASPQTVGEPATLADLLREFHNLEHQLQQVKASLSHSHRLATLGTLAAMLAHEFNNILTPIISYGQLALARPDDAELMRTAVTKSVHSAERAAAICSSLLGFAGEQDQTPLARLPQAIHDAIGCLGRDLKKDGVALTVDSPEVAVAMPAVNVQQVVLNLVLNARKAMRPRGGMLTITVRPNGPAVNIDIADTGPGIPAAIRQKLFEPFVTYPLGEDPVDKFAPAPERPAGESSAASVPTHPILRVARPESAKGVVGRPAGEPRPSADSRACHPGYLQSRLCRTTSSPQALDGDATGPGGSADSPDTGGSADNLGAGAAGGTGLGLSICRDLIVAAGGAIAFDTEEGRGTTFHLTLPRAAAEFEST